MRRLAGRGRKVAEVSLRDYVEQRFVDNAKLYDERAQLQEERHHRADAALTLARDSMERRLDTMNEFRGQLRDQSANFASRLELAALADKIDVMQTSIDKEEGRKAVSMFMTSAVSSLVVGLIVGLVLYFVSHH